MIDVKTLTEEDLNAQVQLLTGLKHFDSAAEIIAQWVYWDDVKRELGLTNDKEPQDDDTGVEVGRGDMKAEMSARMVEEFGDWGPEVGK